MKKFYLFIAALCMAAGTVKAAGSEIYAVINETGFMTMFYDDQCASQGGKTDWSEWKDDATFVYLAPSMEYARPTTTAGWFAGFTKIQMVLNLHFLNTSKVTDMHAMFKDCSSLFTLDVSSFITSNVTTMQNMFSGCEKLTKLDLMSFDVSKVVNAKNMFSGCSALTTIYCVGDWSASTKMTASSDMFSGCTALQGENETTYDDANPKDKTYAHVDGAGGNKGYFTGKKHVYTHFDGDHTLTYYYDSLRFTREGITETYDPIHILGVERFSTYYNKIEKIVISPSMEDAGLYSTARMFSDGFNGLSALTTIEGWDHLKTEKVTNMSMMFYGCTKLQNLDLSMLYTGNVKNMSYMFCMCSSLKSVNLSSFYTWNVTDMQWMFTNCTALEELDLDIFLISNVTNTEYMFANCSALKTIWCNSRWCASDKLTQSDYMFTGCTALEGGRGTPYDDSNPKDKTYAMPDSYKHHGYFSAKPIYPVVYAIMSDPTTMTLRYDDECVLNEGEMRWWDNPAINKDDITKIVFAESFKEAKPESTARWFHGFEALESIEHLEYLNTEDVLTMEYMFYYCSKLTSLDLSHFKTEKVTDMYGMFWHCHELTSLDLSSFDTKNVTNMAGMFWYCRGLTSLNVSSFNTENVKYMGEMFNDCRKLTSLDVSHFNTKNVISMNEMFMCCYSLTSLDVSHFDTENVTNMGGMFESCDALTTLDVSNFKTDKVTDMEFMFAGCRNLTSLDVSNFNTENVETMYAMFNACYALTSLDVSNFKTEKVKNMRGMFRSCLALTALDVSNFNTEKVTTMNGMFSGCEALTSLNISNFNTEEVTDMEEMFRNCKALTSMDVSNFNTEKVTTMYSMFEGCEALEEIICRGDWSQSPSLTNSTAMFKGCTKLKANKGTAFDASHVDVSYAHPDEGTGNPGYFSKYYVVTLQAEHGKVGVQESVDLNKVIPGTVLHLNVLEADEGYEFDKWENYYPTAGLTVNSDTTVTAIFKAQIFTVRFIDWDENLLKQESVAYGASATPPADPTREGYTFTGWGTDEWQNVKRELKVYATYKKEEQGLEGVQNTEYRVQKILHNGQILIERDGKMFYVTGAEVR